MTVAAILARVTPPLQAIFTFLEVKKTHGDPASRCHDIFPALWIPDLFMERVSADASWSLFSPDLGLDDVWGDAFVERYEALERNGRAAKTVQARDVWNAILDAQVVTA